MFNFTTQSVYNLINISGANLNVWNNSSSKTPSLRIGNTRFDASDIESILIKDPSVELLASVTFDMKDVLIPKDSDDKERIARIVLYIGLSMNSLDSFYANDLVYKGKPLYIEFPVYSTDNAATVAVRVAALAKKFLLLVAQEKILDISTDTDTSTEGSETGTVTISGVNGYQLIKKAVLQIFDPSAKVIDCCSNQGDYIDIKIGVPAIYKIVNGKVKTKDGSGKQYYINEDGIEAEITDNLVAILPGLEAFGDYNWIIHNLRLPTAANTNLFAPTKQEMPVVGQQYTLFIITMAKKRDGIAGEVVGQRAESITTHVLYVAGVRSTSSSPAYTVYGLLNSLKSSAIATKADTILANPFGTDKNLTA